MPKNLAACAGAVLLWVAPFSVTEAAIVTWEFKGVVTIDVDSQFALGDVLTGAFSFDDSTAVTSSTGTQARYDGAVRSFSVSGLDALFSTDPGASFNYVRIDDGSLQEQQYTDLFRAVLRKSQDPLPSFDMVLSKVGIGTNPSCIASLSLPSAPYSPLSCFDEMYLQYESKIASVESRLRMKLTDLSLSVPEPSTLTLLGLGLAGLGAVRRKKLAV